MDRVLKEIIAAKEKVEKLRKDNSLVFVSFTDLHASSVRHKYMESLLSVLKVITKEIKYDAVIDMGDNFSMLGRELHISNSDLKKIMGEVMETIYQNIEGPLFLINGNHDAVGTDFFKPDFWNAVVKNRFDDSKARYDHSGSYYYVDYEKKKDKNCFFVNTK